MGGDTYSEEERETLREFSRANTEHMRKSVAEAEAGNKLDKYENPPYAAVDYYLDFCIWKKDKGIHQGMWVAEEQNLGADCICGISDTRDGLIKDLIELGKEYWDKYWRYIGIGCNIEDMAHYVYTYTLTEL